MFLYTVLHFILACMSQLIILEVVLGTSCEQHENMCCYVLSGVLGGLFLFLFSVERSKSLLNGEGGCLVLYVFKVFCVLDFLFKLWSVILCTDSCFCVFICFLVKAYF